MARTFDKRVADGRRSTFAYAFLAALLLAIALVPASAAYAEASTGASLTTFSDDANGGAYVGGAIPILRLTFNDDVDPETGDVVLAGDEKIRLMNEAPNHSYEATGVTLDLEVPATYDNPEDDMWDGASGYTGEASLEIDRISGRGNSTWRAAKKPYKFKLSESTDLFGMGASKRWALIANFYDTSLTVDRLVAWMGDRMGLSFTPRGVPVDLFMNGEYYGNYLLMEDVRVGASRVDIDVVDEATSNPESLEITGDYLIGMNRKPQAQSYEYFRTEREHAFSWDTPEYGEELTDAEKAQQEYLISHMNRVEDAVFGKNLTSASGDNAWDLVDEDSLADYWWIQEFTGNRDAFATPSTYLYKLRDTMDVDGTVTPGKLYWGPLWDFDFVWGEFPAEGFDNTEATWTALLRQDPGFVDLLKQRWQVFDAMLEKISSTGGLLDRYILEMSESWEANQQRWPKEDPYGWADGSYAETIEELRVHAEERRAWINANLDKLQTTYHYLTFMDGDVEVKSAIVREGLPAHDDAPEASGREGMLFVGWFTRDHREYNPDEACEEDAVFYATYVDPSTVSSVQDVFFTVPELWITGRDFISYTLMPRDAVDKRITWSSSDESVVTVDEDGMVSAVDGCLGDAETASATVTAHMVGSGKSASLRVVVYDKNRVDIPEPTSVTVEPKVTVEEGGYHQVSFTAEPVPSTLNQYNDLSYEVDNSEIAEVTYLGIIHAKKPGVARITVTRSGSNMGKAEVAGVIVLTVTEKREDGGDGGDGADNGGSVEVGETFAPLKLAGNSTSKSSVKLSWAKLAGVKQYVVYGGQSGKKFKMKKLKTVAGNKVTIKKVGKKLAKGKAYKFTVEALDKDGKVLSASKVVYVFTKGGKFDNPKSVKIAKRIVSKAKKLTVGKALKLKAKMVKKGNKKIKKLSAVRYESTNAAVATVSGKGVVKAKGKGKCYVYAFAQNGVAKRVRVVVR